MNCETCQTLLTQYILGELDSRQTDEVTEHLASGCQECLRSLSEIDQSIEQLIEHTPLRSPSQDTWALIAAAIDAGPSHAFDHVSTKHPSNSAQNVWIGLLSIACGFGLTALTLRTFVTSRADDRVELVMPVDGAESALSFDGDDRIASKPSTLVSFHQPKRPQLVAGTMLIDTQARQIHVHVRLSNQGGTRFSFWFVTQDDRWIKAGELKSLSGDHFGNLFDVPNSDVPIVYAAITVEPKNPSDQPTQVDIALISDSF